MYTTLKATQTPLKLAMGAALFGLWVSQSSAQNPPGPDESVRIEFPNSPVSAVLPYYEKLTGKRIIRDAKLDGAQLSISSSEPLTQREAVGFIESALLLNGYALIPVDAKTLKVINYEAGKSPRSQGLPVLSSPDQLPEGDAVVNYVMSLTNISPQEAVRTFGQVVTLNPYGAITPLNHANGIVITENTAVIRSLIELKTHLDVPTSQISNQIIELKRADAEKIAEIINTVFEDQDTSPASAIGAVGAPAAPAGPAGDAGLEMGPGPSDLKVKVIPYRRTNSLLVIARPVDMTYIRGLAEAFDKPSDAATFMRRKLQYVSIVDYLPAFYNAISRNTDVERRDENLLKPEDVAQGNSNNPTLTNNSGGGGGFGMDGGGLGGGFGIYPDRLSEPEPFTAPQSYVVGNTLMIADPQANTLIVSGSPEHVETVQQLIDEVDVQPKQVYISTVIGQLTLGDELEYSLSAFKQLDSFTPSATDGLNLYGAGALDPSGNTVVGAVKTFRDASALATSNGLSLLGSFVDGNNASIDVLLRLFARDNKFRLLSRPSVYAQNNSKAVILSGQRIAVPTSTLTSVNNGIGGGSILPGSIASNIEYLDVVLKLEVVPLINSDNEVTLRIAQVNDTVVGQQIISGNVIPTLNTQELVTTITVPNGKTIVLGGLITERSQDDQTGLPGIRKIPVLGRVLGSTDVKLKREELLIFIQPFIMDGHNFRPNDVEVGRTASTVESEDFANPKFENLIPVEAASAKGTPAPAPAATPKAPSVFRQLFRKPAKPQAAVSKSEPAR